MSLEAGLGEPPPVKPSPIVEGPTVSFEVVAEESAIEISGASIGSALQPQGEGSLKTSFSGSVRVVLGDQEIAFSPETRLIAQNNGNWEPKTGGAPGREPANFGVKTQVLFATALSAVRNLDLSLAAGSQAIVDGTFPVAGLEGLVSDDSKATLDFAAGGFVPIIGSRSLAGGSGVSQSSALGRIQTVGGMQKIVIPVDIEFKLQLIVPGDTTLRFQGQITARRDLQPPPPTPAEPPQLAAVRIDSIERVNGRGIRFEFNAQPGVSYGIERSADLRDWIEVASGLSGAFGKLAWFAPIEDANAFFRVTF